MNRPYIDRAIKLLDKQEKDIPFIDNTIEMLFVIIDNHFGKLEIGVKNGIIDLVKKVEMVLMK